MLLESQFSIKTHAPKNRQHNPILALIMLLKPHFFFAICFGTVEQAKNKIQDMRSQNLSETKNGSPNFFFFNVCSIIYLSRRDHIKKKMKTNQLPTQLLNTMHKLQCSPKKKIAVPQKKIHGRSHWDAPPPFLGKQDATPLIDSTHNQSPQLSYSRSKKKENFQYETQGPSDLLFRCWLGIFGLVSNWRFMGFLDLLRGGGGVGIRTWGWRMMSWSENRIWSGYWWYCGAVLVDRGW